MRARKRLGAALVSVAVVGLGLGAVPASAAGETITAQVTTANPQVGQELAGSGEVSPGTTTTVAITRDDAATTGTPVTTAPTNAQGSFTFTDTPPVRGSVTYHFTDQLSLAMTTVQITVAGEKPYLTIRTPSSVVRAGRTVTVTAHLGSNPKNRNVTVYAVPYNGSPVTLQDNAPVDGSGNLTATYHVLRRTTFSVHFAGDSVFNPAWARTLVKAHPVIGESLKGGYASSNGYRLFHASGQPLLVANLMPLRGNACLYFRAQHYYHGGWHTSTLSGCIRTDSQGYAAGALTGSHAIGEPYRLRAEWHATTAWSANNGVWVKLKFRR